VQRFALTLFQQFSIASIWVAAVLMVVILMVVVLRLIA